MSITAHTSHLIYSFFLKSFCMLVELKGYHVDTYHQALSKWNSWLIILAPFPGLAGCRCSLRTDLYGRGNPNPRV